MRRRRSVKRKKIPRRIVFVFAVIVLILTISAHKVYSKVSKWDKLIYPNVRIENVNVSGKTKEQAKQLVHKKISKVITEKKIDVKVLEKTYSMNISKINPSYDIDKAVEQAFKYGKNGTIYKRYKTIKDSVFKNYDIKLKYDEKPIDDFILSIKKNVDKKSTNAQIIKNGKNFSISASKNGSVLDTEKLKKDLIICVEKEDKGEKYIKASIKDVKPTVTEKQLEKINKKIASYTTKYGSISSRARAKNIELSTKTIDGTLVMPGESFSFNKKLGKRTPEKGYEKAGVLIGNSVANDYGGGICQVSTTMYNAILMSNIKSTARTHHTEPSHYGKIGLDATVDYASGTDYKFKNTLKYPIYIEAYTASGIIGFNIYSNSEMAKKIYKLRSEKYAIIKPKTIYKDDDSIEVGQTKVEQKSKDGYKVKSYIDVYEDGKLAKSELISNDYYKEVNSIVLRGTKE